MTSDNLLKFLGNREYLHQVSYQELKSMVVQYPYSLSLRYLLAMKSQQEDNTDLDRNIEMLATYGIDRTHLHKIFSEDPIVLEDLEETIIMGEDYLELKELSSLEREMESSLVKNEVSSISFLEEELPRPSANPTTPILEEPEDQPSPLSSIEPEIEAVEEEPETKVETDDLFEEAIAASAIVGGATLIEKNNSVDEVLNGKPIIENPQEPLPELGEIPTKSEIEEEKEDFIIMDFEEHTLDEVGTAISSDDLVPSESFSSQDIVMDEHGLPADAEEINDSYDDYKKEKEGKINDLFKEAEEEVLAEEAVSDSKTFVDNPEELLIGESEKVLAETTSLASTSKEVEPEAAAIFNNEKKRAGVSLKLDKPRPQIPFEISYVKIDPVAINEPESSDTKEEIISTESTSIAEETSEELKEAVESTQTEEASTVLREFKKPQESEETFKFDSLDQFEAKLNQEKSTISTKPIPKSGFNSWQEKYSGVSALSGINLMPLDKTKGKIIRKKKKIVRKQFEKTVAFAEESLTMTDGIASETLAQLLVKQGQYSQARAMYAKLCLIIPEKSSFFAGEIEKIQNLPDEPS